MIAIVDYGVGNLFSLTASLKALGFEARVIARPEELRQAERIILPGVGAFGDARAKLEDTGLVPVLLEEARRSHSWASAWGCSSSSTGASSTGSTRALAWCPARWRICGRISQTKV